MIFNSNSNNLCIISCLGLCFYSFHCILSFLSNMCVLVVFMCTEAIMTLVLNGVFLVDIGLLRSDLAIRNLFGRKREQFWVLTLNSWETLCRRIPTLRIDSFGELWIFLAFLFSDLYSFFFFLCFLWDCSWSCVSISSCSGIRT